MDMRNMGRSGLAVSALGLGCNNFGMRIDQAGADAVVAAALDAGITVFDTADIYGGGESERMLGRALGARRHEVSIVTKLGIVRDHPAPRGGSRTHVLRTCETSLRRLGTDHIDLLLLHKPDPVTPLEETLAALDTLVRDGKVRYIGCSNFAAWQLVDADHLARRAGGERFIAVQAEWSLLERALERELVPAARHLGTGVMAYFPLASGLLTGKYQPDAPPPAGSRMAELPTFAASATPERLRRVAQLQQWAGERGHTLLELAMSWLVAQRDLACVLFGATRPQQVLQNVQAAQWRLSAEDMSALDALLAEPPTP